MAVESIRSPGPEADDPDLGMGLALLAQQRKERIILATKIGLVWIGLIIFLLVVLLRLRLIPRMFSSITTSSCWACGPRLGSP